MTRGYFAALGRIGVVAQNTKPVDGSGRGGGRLFGPVMTWLNPLLYIYFLRSRKEGRGGGPLFSK